MAGRFTGSKFKHAIGAPYKKENTFPDLRPATAAGESDAVAASAFWLAVAWASPPGEIALLDALQPGKRSTSDVRTVRAHSGPLCAMQFSPHSDLRLATSGDDGLVKIWELGMPADVGLSPPETVHVLQGHSKKVDAIAWHPSAKGVLASGGSDKAVRVWNTETGECIYEFKDFAGDAVQCLAWSYDGSKLVVGSKDKKVRMFDPRKGADSVQVADSHAGIKASRCVWLGNKDMFVTTGFGRMRERQFSIWDAKVFKTVKTVTVDSNTGVLDVFYDPDTQLLVLAGKGDGSVKILDMDVPKAPFYRDLTVIQTDEGQKSVAFVPKRACDVMGTEVLKLAKLTTGAVVPIGVSVPRKTKSQFHDDLFPPTASLEPALTAAAYFGGSNKAPVLVQLSDDVTSNRFLGAGAAGGAAAEAKAAAEAAAAEAAEAERKAREAAAAVQPAGPKPSLGGRVYVKQPEAEPEKRVFKKVQVVRKTHFRHIFGRGTKKELHWDGLEPSTAANTSMVKANAQYFAIPWKGAGGRVAILDLDKPGRQEHVNFLELGSDCLDFDWSPFDNSKLAAVTENAQVQIWDIPEGGLTEVARTPTVSMKGHMRRTQIVSWHPWAGDVLATSSYDLSVRLWDVQAQVEKICVPDCHEDFVMSLGWNYDGSLLVTASRDKKLRLIDPRAGNVVMVQEAHDGAKGFRATWCGNRNQIVSVGHSRTSERMLNLWDVRNFSSSGSAESLRSLSVDNGAGLMTPFFDEDINILYTVGKGEGTVKMYEINDEAPHLHYLTSYADPAPAQGMAILPKARCNVRDVEIAKWIKLGSNYAEEVTFRVPRTRTEFFQDDVFPETRDFDAPTLTGTQWFDGASAEPQLKSLCPADMELLSLAPPEDKEKRHVEVAAEGIDADKMKELVMDAFHSKMTELSESDTQVLKQEKMEGAADEEWDDY